MYIFRQAKDAMFHFENYPKILKTKLSKVILYALFFIIILNIISISIPFLANKAKIKSFENFIETYVPDFKIENNKIIFDKYKKENTPLNITFIFEPEDKNLSISKEDKENSQLQIFKFTPSYMMTYPQNISVKIDDIINIFNIKQKSDLINLKPFIYFCNAISMFVLLFLFIYKNIIYLILTCLLVSILASFYGLITNFKNIFILSIYVSTAPFLLSKIFSFLSIHMPTIIYIGILIAYLNFAFKIIKLDISNTKRL